jgi:hypothetical protein
MKRYDLSRDDRAERSAIVNRHYTATLPARPQNIGTILGIGLVGLGLFMIMNSEGCGASVGINFV